MATHNSVVATASHYSCSCCLSSPSMIPLLPPPSTSSSSSTGHTRRYCFSLPSCTPSCCSTHLSPTCRCCTIPPLLLPATPSSTEHQPSVATSSAVATYRCYH
ncbi:hypothetical protein B296_00004947 [Ensete ventricosum]|uniref:Uncharacterized protein n=1 Tax=Ensete ventricosum TaxID=4639 RepID=A0A426ZIB3_ENSVE|nr:hypothetical protein B296_00004947 [Ensete ventricosum]